MENKQTYQMPRGGSSITKAPNGSGNGSDAGKVVTGTDLRAGK